MRDMAAVAEAARRARRLGVLGGSFDPPHLGHLHVARAAGSAFDLDHVLLVPAARPPHKPGRRLASGEDRVAMLELLIGEAAGSPPDLSIWTGELERQGPSFAIDSARELREALGSHVKLFWILGSDNLVGLPTWRAAAELLRSVQPIVVYRQGEPLDADEPGGLDEETRERLRRGRVEVPPFAASSSDLRRALEQGREPGPALPARLREYARTHGIYSTPWESTP